MNFTKEDFEPVLQITCYRLDHEIYKQIKLKFADTASQKVNETCFSIVNNKISVDIRFPITIKVFKDAY